MPNAMYPVTKFTPVSPFQVGSADSCLEALFAVTISTNGSGPAGAVCKITMLKMSDVITAAGLPIRRCAYAFILHKMNRRFCETIEPAGKRQTVSAHVMHEKAIAYIDRLWQ